ncbi:hypothetical protein AXW83_14900 [Bosea sp. PAMC 26642]|nr:hypothetical protein AXW83_14900 [Bosea sp. PAMC 26642]
MFGLTSKILAKRRAWKSAVSLSAGILIRDEGDGAYFAARRLSRKARTERNEKADRFWGAVAREIAARTGKVIGM